MILSDRLAPFHWCKPNHKHNNEKMSCDLGNVSQLENDNTYIHAHWNMMTGILRETDKFIINQ